MGLKSDGSGWTGVACYRIRGQLLGYCEHSNESSDSVRCG